MRIANTPAVASNGKEVIDQRIKLMKAGVYKHYQYVKTFLKDGKGTVAGAHASLLNDSAKKITVLFPKGSGRDYSDAEVTRALPKIWEDWNGFEAATAALTRENAKLAEVA